MILAKNATRWLVAALVFVTVVEVCIRAEDSIRWNADFWGPYSHSLLSATDSIGRRNRPSTTFEKWRVNRFGFRGPEIEMNGSPDRVRVAVLGASETFGLYESPGMEFPAQMQDMLDELDPGGYEVVNVAIPGASPPHLRDYYERWVSKFSPDVVVIYPAPAFYLDDRPPRLPETRPAPRDPVIEQRYDLRIVEESRNRIKQFLPARLQGWMKAWSIDRVVADHDPSWVFTEVPGDRVALFQADLIELVQAVERSGAEVVLGTNANRFERPLDEDDMAHLVSWRRFLPRASETVLVDMAEATNDVIRDVARERGLPMADVAEQVPADPQYFADFTHFTDLGAQAAAETFVRTLVRTSFVEAGVGAGF